MLTMFRIIFIRIWRLLTIILLALFMGLGVARTLKPPAQMQYDGTFYVTIQNIVYTTILAHPG